MQIVIDIDEDLYEGIKKRDGALETEYVCNELMKAIDNGTPQQKTGEWCKQNDDYFDWYECSECGYVVESEMQYSNEYDARTNYCPNCGAKMIESEEEYGNYSRN